MGHVQQQGTAASAAHSDGYIYTEIPSMNGQFGRHEGRIATEPGG